MLFVKFFFNNEKVLKFLNCSLCLKWDHGFSMCYVNVVHCLLSCLLAKALQSYPTLCDPHGQQPTRLLCPQDSLGMNSGVGCHFLLQRGAWYQCILLWWSILAFQEKSHLCILYNSYYMNWYKWLHIYVYTYVYTHTHAHNFSSGFLNPGRLTGGQEAALDHRS